MKKREKGYKMVILLEMIVAVISLVIGLITYLKSDITKPIVGLIIGTLFLIQGIVWLFSFIEKNKIKLFQFNIFTSILSILLGLFTLFNPLSLGNGLNISLGLYLLINGGQKLCYFGILKSIKEESNKIVLTSALLFIFQGILLIINLFNLETIKIIGAFLFLASILNINDLVLLQRRGKELLKEFK